jgi:hypothetical protein
MAEMLLRRAIYVLGLTYTCLLFAFAGWCVVEFFGGPALAKAWLMIAGPPIGGVLWFLAIEWPPYQRSSDLNPGNALQHP